MVWITNFITKNKNPQQYVVLNTEMSRTMVLFLLSGSSGYLLSETCRQNSIVEWHWLNFLEPNLLVLPSVSFLRQTARFVINGWRTGQPSPSTLTLNGFTRRVVLTPANVQIWLVTFPVALQFICVFFYFVICNYLFAKSIRSHSDIEKMAECFAYVSLKYFNFVLET